MRVQNSSNQAGSAMVELALVVSVMIPLFTGVFQFGYGFYNYNQVIAAVRNGARYASLAKYDSSTSTPSVAFQTAVKNMVVYGNPTGGSVPLVSGLNTSQVLVSVTTVGGTPDIVTVSLQSWTLDTVFKRFVFANKPAASFRYAGLYAP